MRSGSRRRRARLRRWWLLPAQLRSDPLQHRDPRRQGITALLDLGRQHRNESSALLIGQVDGRVQRPRRRFGGRRVGGAPIGAGSLVLAKTSSKSGRPALSFFGAVTLRDDLPSLRTMNIAEGLKNAGMVFGGLVVLGLLLGLSALLIGSATAVSLWLLQWTQPVFWLAVAISLFILAPLALIPPARAAAAIGFVVASYVFGAIMWIWGITYTYVVWGFFGVIIGLVIMGVGVVPIAMLASLLHADWMTLVGFVISAVLTFGLRALALWLAKKVDERAARLSGYPLR